MARRHTPLAGIVNGNVAKTQQADQVEYFEGTLNGGTYTVYVGKDVITLCTPKCTAGYTLCKHATQNYYHGILNGAKVQVSLKKIVGELRAWY